MRVKQREVLRIIHTGPLAGNGTAPDPIEVYARLEYPVQSQSSMMRGELMDQLSAYYTTRYTSKLDPVLREPPNWSIQPQRHPKYKGKTTALLAANLDRRGKMVELRF